MKTSTLLKVMLAVVVTIPLSAMPGNPNPGVLPPHSNAYGKTLEEWSAAWWQWVAGIPTGNNPLLDETGENCGIDQSGKVWYLGGTPVGAVERACTIPQGKALLFPVLNAVLFNCPAENATENEMRDILTDFFDATTCQLEVTIDGIPLNSLEIYRVQSPAFTMTIPADHIFLGFCDEDAGGDLPAGDHSPAVSEGFWILHTPLPEGEHEIFFRGVLCNPETGAPFFETEVTLSLTVGD